MAQEAADDEATKRTAQGRPLHTDGAAAPAIVHGSSGAQKQDHSNRPKKGKRCGAELGSARVVHEAALDLVDRELGVRLVF